MPASHLFIASRLVPFILCLASLVIPGAATSSAPPSPSPSEISTCPSRTINYITETLPQQCLRTSWRGAVGSGEEKRALQSIPDNVDRDTTSLTTGNSSPEVVNTIVYIAEGTSHATITTDEVSASQLSSTATETIKSATSQGPSSPVQEANTESDTDPLSDNASFLSFEEWKAQMLKKAGQSPEVVGNGRTEDRKPETRRPLGEINNALDSLGEEGEIELDFAGFVNPDSAADALPSAKLGGTSLNEDSGKQAGLDKSTEGQPKHRKDAGTTSKERFNYASFDCAATVLKTNPECKGTNSVLVENKDSYMLNACPARNKFIIVELCNDILIDTIVLGNFEFFSSTFRTFRASISDRYPVKLDKWRELGTFEARNTRGLQVFLVENGLIWARYLRIEFLTHYGNEYYCPISLLRVHGKTMMDDYRNDVKLSRGEEDNDDDVVPEDEDPGGSASDFIITEPIQVDKSTASEKPSVDEHLTQTSPLSKSITNDTTSWALNDTCPRTSYRSPLVQQTELFTAACIKQSRFCNLEHVHVIRYTSVVMSIKKPIPNRSLTAPESTQNSTKALADDHDVTKGKLSTTSTPTTKTATKDDKKPTHQDEFSGLHSSHTGLPSSKGNPNSSETFQPSRPQVDQANTATFKSPSQPPAATPTTQESFFKSIHKRLQQLEANSTLSLQYIEEQSRILREAFTKVEKRQLAKTTTFLETLNVTVLSELREFRLQYDQIWQSTVLELSSQREQSQREVIALSSRLTLLADEILWQRRLVYLEFGLILLCLGLVIFFRNPAGSSPYLELPLLQNMVSKPSASFARYLNLDSPPSSRPVSRYGLFSRGTSHLRSPSEETTLHEDDGKGPNIGYHLPTPTSETGDLRQQSTRSSPEAEVGLRRTISTPIFSHELKQSDDLLESSDVEDYHPSPTEARAYDPSQGGLSSGIGIGIIE